MRVAAFLLFCVTLAAQDRVLGREAAIGREMARDVRRSATLVEPQAVQDYVGRLGDRLAVELPNSAFPYTLSVASLEHVNALHEPLTLPGGYIFVPLSLLLAAQDEAEFAGMLAQAMARGPLELRSDFKSDAGTIPLIFVGGAGDSLLMPVSMLERSRQSELQADTTAARAMYHAGFDPAALLRYIERVQVVEPRLSPLPPRVERVAALERTIRDLPSAAYAQSDEFYRIQEQARLLAPERVAPAPRRRPSLLKTN